MKERKISLKKPGQPDKGLGFREFLAFFYGSPGSREREYAGSLRQLFHPTIDDLARLATEGSRSLRRAVSKLIVSR